MRKRDLRVDTDYVVAGDALTAHRLVRLKDPDNPQRVLTRVGDTYVSIHPSRLKAPWDHPEVVAVREAYQRRQASRRQAIDLAERLGLKVARDGDGWEAHRDAEARITYLTLGPRPGRDGALEIDLDAWLRLAPELVGLLGEHDEALADWRAG